MRRGPDIGYVAAITHDAPSIRNLLQLTSLARNDYVSAWRSHAWMAIIVIGVYALARTAAAVSIATDNALRGLMLDLAGPIVATGLALPWFTLSTAVAQALAAITFDDQ